MAAIKTALLILLALSCRVLAFTANDGAKTILTDGSYADTSDAWDYVDAKNEDGWVMTVGSAGGSYTWATRLTVGDGHVFTIQGASSSNRPTITPTGTDGFDIVVGVTDGKLITIKDLIFEEQVATQNAFILISGNGEDTFRVSNVLWNHNQGNGAAMWVGTIDASTGAGPYGLIDHCEIQSGTSGYGIYVRDTTNSWTTAMSWGTKKAVYIEDCVFTASVCSTGSPAIDSNQGGRMVFRHNTLTNYSTGSHGAEPNPDSVLQVEIAHNLYQVTSGQGIAWTYLSRGGSTRYHHNTTAFITGNYTDSQISVMFKMQFNRAVIGNGVCAVDRAYPDDYLGTQQPGTGYVGVAGQDPQNPSALWGSVPNYSWANSNGVFNTEGEASTTAGGFVALDRNYFLSAAPGHTEYTYPHPLQGGAAPEAGGSTTFSGSGTTTFSGSGTTTIGQ